MSRGARIGAAVLLAFVAYRVLVEVIELPSALLVGAAVGGATWLLTGRLASRHAEPADADEDQ